MKQQPGGGEAVSRMVFFKEQQVMPEQKTSRPMERIATELSAEQWLWVSGGGGEPVCPPQGPEPGQVCKPLPE